MSKEYEIVIPDESFVLVDSEEDGLPAKIKVNENLLAFEPKLIFGWHLSIQFTLQALDENGLPTAEESEALSDYEEFLNENITGPKVKPNGLYVGSVTWNRRRELMFLVHDPEVADKFLKFVCERNDTPRGLHYEMEHDPEWGKAMGYLQLLGQ